MKFLFFTFFLIVFLFAWANLTSLPFIISQCFTPITIIHFVNHLSFVRYFMLVVMWYTDEIQHYYSRSIWGARLTFDLLLAAKLTVYCSFIRSLLHVLYKSCNTTFYQFAIMILIIVIWNYRFPSIVRNLNTTNWTKCFKFE